MSAPSPAVFRSRTATGRVERLALATARERVARMRRRLAATEPGTSQRSRALSRLTDAEVRLERAEKAAR